MQEVEEVINQFGPFNAISNRLQELAGSFW
jgi:hypothetical protein